MFFKKNHASTPEQSLTNSLEAIEHFKKHAKTQKCPACNKDGLFKLASFESGIKGWEIRFCCDCGLTAVLNQTGYHFEGRPTSS